MLFWFSLQTYDTENRKWNRNIANSWMDVTSNWKSVPLTDHIFFTVLMITFTPSNRFPHKSNDKSNRCQRPSSSISAIRIVQTKVACQKNEFHLLHRRNQAVAVSYHLRDLTRINVLFEISINIDMGQNTDTLSLLSDQLLRSIEEDPYRVNENTKTLRYHLMVRLLIQDKVFTANWTIVHR